MLQDYSKSLHLIGRCATVEQWWGLYCRLIRPSALKPFRELHLFKNGIKAMWEDPSNAKGGKWVIRLRKNKIDRAWENLCMAMLGEQFLVGTEICGVVLSTRFPVIKYLILFFFFIACFHNILFCFVWGCSFYRKICYRYGIEHHLIQIVQHVFGIH